MIHMKRRATVRCAHCSAVFLTVKQMMEHKKVMHRALRYRLRVLAKQDAREIIRNRKAVKVIVNSDKYFFGYCSQNGVVFPQKWIEDSGVTTGGEKIILQKVEISRKMWNRSLSELQGLFEYRPS